MMSRIRDPDEVSIQEVRGGRSSFCMDKMGYIQFIGWV